MMRNPSLLRKLKQRRKDYACGVKEDGILETGLKYI
jgi:hypothetical protein